MKSPSDDMDDPKARMLDFSCAGAARASWLPPARRAATPLRAGGLI